MNGATPGEYRPDSGVLDDLLSSAGGAHHDVLPEEQRVWRWIFGTVAVLSLTALLLAVPIVVSAGLATQGDAGALAVVLVLSVILALTLVFVITVAAAGPSALRCMGAATHLVRQIAGSVVLSLPTARRTREHFHGIRVP